MDNDRTNQYIAQQAILDAHQKRLDKIEETIAGIPQEMQFIRENVDRLCINMDKILEKLETRYVPRDLYDTTVTNLRAQFECSVAALNERVTWLTRGIIVCALYLIKDLVPLLLK